jgi:hypothetical protein
MPISDEERRRREHDVVQAGASAALEGVTIDPATAELQAQWARGEISEHEMIARARAAFGVPEQDR